MMSEQISLKDWLTERLENCERLAARKSGTDRDGWLEDADYFRQTIAELDRLRAENEQLREDLVLQHAEIHRLLEELVKRPHWKPLPPLPDPPKET